MLKTINIITTAALPWRTGTAVLPLMRAYHLAKRGFEVTLYLPWISPKQQYLLFGEQAIFQNAQEQEECNRSFLPKLECPTLRIEFYPGNYRPKAGSIFPSSPLDQVITPCDWLILEEPEHLNWLHPLNRYSIQASRVTGIVVTNYAYYLKYHAFGGSLWAKMLSAYNRWLVNRHCHDVIRVSDVLLKLPRSQCLYVNGVQPEFFDIPKSSSYPKSIYFMGKIIWPKGFKELIDLLAQSEHREIDTFGTGIDQKAIENYAVKKGVQIHSQGTSTNPSEDLREYKIFFNASRSEIICTTTVEAFVQGKFVILPRDPSNEYFYRFKNCLAYSSPQEFLEKLRFALDNNPEEDPKIEECSWDSAVDRLLDYHRQI